MKSLDLKQLEQKAYRSTFQDGLWDIFTGVMILGMGMSALLKNMGIPKPIHFLVFPFIALLIAYAGKNYIRLFLFGLLAGVSIIAAEILYPHFGSPLDGLIPFSLVGILIITSGLVLLIRFLKKYPKPSKEVTDDKSRD